MSGFLIGEDVLVVGDVFDTTAAEWREWLQERAANQAYTKDHLSFPLTPVPEQQEQEQGQSWLQQQGREDSEKGLPTPFAAGPASPEFEQRSMKSSSPSVPMAYSGSKSVKGSGVGVVGTSGSSSSYGASGVLSLVPSTSLRPKGPGTHKRVKKNRTSVQVESSNSGMWSQVSRGRVPGWFSYCYNS